VSLRKCPDCGNDVSSSARACPHCGRPCRKSQPPLRITAGLGLAVICVVALSWQSGWQGDTAGTSVTSPAPQETVIARPYRQLEQSLAASIGYNRRLYLFRVENRDTFPWTNCQLSLNSQGISGYDLEVESIKPGLTDAALLQSAEFADSNGKRFDPSAESVATLDLDCETPGGHLYYRGKFGSSDSRSAAILSRDPATPSPSALVASMRTALHR
jgi:hypothetical protein